MHTPAACRTQQCFAVKNGVDGFLDVARQTFCRVTEQVRGSGDPRTAALQPGCRHLGMSTAPRAGA